MNKKVVWIVAGVSVGGCCLFGTGLLALGAVAGGEDAKDAPAAEAREATAEVDDDFVYASPNGTFWVAPSSVAAEGVQVTLVGEWRDDHRHITLRLKDGGRYELTHGGAVLVGTAISNAVAEGATDAERGTWSLEGSTMTFTPEGRQISASVGTRNLGAGEEQAEAPRAWTVTGVTIEYTPEGQTASRQRPGLRIRGPSPDWYYPSGPWDLVLRSAPWSG